VQGRPRDRYLSVQVETDCAHDPRPMAIAIESNLRYQTADDAGRPVVCVPDVDLFNLAADSIVEAF